MMFGQEMFIINIPVAIGAGVGPCKFFEFVIRWILFLFIIIVYAPRQKENRGDDDPQENYILTIARKFFLMKHLNVKKAETEFQPFVYNLKNLKTKSLHFAANQGLYFRSR